MCIVSEVFGNVVGAAYSKGASYSPENVVHMTLVCCFHTDHDYLLVF